MLVKQELWQPVGGLTLEKESMHAVKSPYNALVTAGPGAGKTELLGQRGVFLMQTGLCPYPRRILAISFKRDAAKNLRERFHSRCSKEKSSRLDSLTFDAFAKMLFERLWKALPPLWTMNQKFKLSVQGMPREQFREFQQTISDSLKKNISIASQIAKELNFFPTYDDIHSISYDLFNLAIHKINLLHPQISSTDTFLKYVHLRNTLSQTPCYLDFPMIGRLLELLIETNPQIKNAILSTYSHVFIDEFQDTTGVQYGLIKAIFKGTDSIITAVGDDKQKIMEWAGAQKNNFESFRKEFFNPLIELGEQDINLAFNYRSNQRIVDILNVLKKRLVPDEPDFKAKKPAPNLPSKAICSVVISNNEDAEAHALGRFIQQAINAGVSPRNICLLVKQKANDQENLLLPIFEKYNIALRNEARIVGNASIQDLSTEPYSLAVINMLEILTMKRSPKLGQQLINFLFEINKVDEVYDQQRAQALHEEFNKFREENFINNSAIKLNAEIVNDILLKINGFWGLKKIQDVFPQYQDIEFFRNICESTKKFIEECSEGVDFKQMIINFRGESSVPLMTITKSKGLEFDIVILLGLHDDQWWSFSSNPDEGHCNFFVAASRAKERLYMTTVSNIRKHKIREIFSLLKESSVDFIDAESFEYLD